MYDEVVGVADSVMDQDRESQASKLVDHDSHCLVPGTETEFYDCCSDTSSYTV